MKAFDRIVNELYTTLATLPDKRTGQNVQFPMQDIGLTAFAVFFMQSPSFLYAQESLQKKTGKNNLKSLFRVERIPSENQVRALLDPIRPEVFFPV
ncbi:MAG: ISNCY family transposase, partial [Verrucomicrobiota bacterium]|nr:ISNCY family transposase [Verrucomicrobiota bacterium]